MSSQLGSLAFASLTGAACLVLWRRRRSAPSTDAESCVVPVQPEVSCLKTCPVHVRQLEHLAGVHGTPFQLYDEAGIRAAVRRVLTAFGSRFPRYRQHFAVKALPNPAILRVLIREGCGLDCSSRAELASAAAVGCPGASVCFTSNYTSRADLGAAAAAGVILNLDDTSLVPELVAATSARGLPFPDLISFRLNPGVGRTDSSTTSNVLGGPGAKFGVPRTRIVAAYAAARAAGASRFGMHMMTGSCVMSPAYWEEAVGLILDAAAEVRAALGVEFEFVNIGGGLGVPYRPGTAPVDVDDVAQRIRRVWDAKLALHDMPEPALHTEHGRYITAPSGWLVARCQAVKRAYGATYFGLDACMAHLMRPGMYGAYHHITVPAKEGAEVAAANVVGSLCENNDWFAHSRPLPKTASVGDLFVIHDTGAHGHSMGFNYNGALRAPELLLRSRRRPHAGLHSSDSSRARSAESDHEPSPGSTHFSSPGFDREVDVIRERETVERLYANCRMPGDLAVDA